MRYVLQWRSSRLPNSVCHRWNEPVFLCSNSLALDLLRVRSLACSNEKILAGHVLKTGTQKTVVNSSNSVFSQVLEVDLSARSIERH